jgi:hypothetical protein
VLISISTGALWTSNFPSHTSPKQQLIPEASYSGGWEHGVPTQPSRSHWDCLRASAERPHGHRYKPKGSFLSLPKTATQSNADLYFVLSLPDSVTLRLVPRRKKKVRFRMQQSNCSSLTRRAQVQTRASVLLCKY